MSRHGLLRLSRRGLRSSSAASRCYTSSSTRRWPRRCRQPTRRDFCAFERCDHAASRALSRPWTSSRSSGGSSARARGRVGNPRQSRPQLSRRSPNSAGLPTSCRRSAPSCTRSSVFWSRSSLWSSTSRYISAARRRPRRSTSRTCSRSHASTWILGGRRRNVQRLCDGEARAKRYLVTAAVARSLRTATVAERKAAQVTGEKKRMNLARGAPEVCVRGPLIFRPPRH